MQIPLELAEQIQKGKIVLFCGVGIQVVRHLGRHKRRAYAVQLRPRELDVKYWEQKNVQVIDADATEFLEEIEQRLTSALLG